MSKTVDLDIPRDAEARARRAESRRLAMELAEPIQEAGARLFELYLKEAVSPLKARIAELEAEIAQASKK